jgi:hypothetical protein
MDKRFMDLQFTDWCAEKKSPLTPKGGTGQCNEQRIMSNRHLSPPLGVGGRFSPFGGRGGFSAFKKFYRKFKNKFATKKYCFIFASLFNCSLTFLN